MSIFQVGGLSPFLFGRSESARNFGDKTTQSSREHIIDKAVGTSQLHLSLSLLRNTLSYIMITFSGWADWDKLKAVVASN